MAAGNISQASVMAMLCLFLFMFWNVGFSSADHHYTFPEHLTSELHFSNIEVRLLNDFSHRVKRQSELEAHSTNSTSIPPNSTTQRPTTTSTATTTTTTTASSTKGTNTGNTNNNGNGGGDMTNMDDTSTLSPDDNDLFADADVKHLNHKYYTSSTRSNGIELYWSELENAKQHQTLSNGHRVAAVIQLKFPFYFYGHKVTNVTVATGGFIYMSYFLHQWLTTTQYIAPLMANFDTSLSSGSQIIYQSTPDNFTVEWKDVLLRDQRDVGKFRFQAVLKRDNSIQFLYKNLPIPINEISPVNHPVRVGLSDAWYNDTYIPEAQLMRRTIIEYHRVMVNISLIQNSSVVVLNPLPTCNRLSDCDSCTRHVNVSFDCKWCNIIGRCSDGPDWYRQHWNKRGCGDASTSDLAVCSTTARPPIESTTTTTRTPVTTPPARTTSTSKPTTNKPSTPKPMTDQPVTSKPLTPKPSTNKPPHVTDNWTAWPQISSTTITTTTTTSKSMITGKPDTSDKFPSTSGSGADKNEMHGSEDIKVACATHEDPSICSSLPQPKHPVVDPHATPIIDRCQTKFGCDPTTTTTTTTPFTLSEEAATNTKVERCANGQCNSGSSFPVAAVVISVLFVGGLIVAVGGWVYYAYTHPTSKSGMWLMEHRPSQIKAKIKFWKSNSASGAKYQTETDA